MFSLRVHSVDAYHPLYLTRSAVEDVASTITTTSTNSTSVHTYPNFDIQERRALIHLYRNNLSRPSSSLLPNPNVRTITNSSQESTLLFVLAVPNHLSIDDFIRFCGSYVDHFSEILVFRNDGMEDRYSVLIKLVDQKKADSFYRNFNGRHFSSAEELPTCPVCLERLDQDTSGILTAVCDHSFQCLCISKWTNSSCPVCRFCQQETEKPTCVVCATMEDLWICLICGFVGCGRYKEGHAIRHWKETQHCYSLDLEAQRVWDYVGDTYVHRLNQSKADGKMVHVNPHCQSFDGDCGTCECSEDSGISGVAFSSKVEAIVDEYNRLLAGQLENQRHHYETLLAEAKGKTSESISDELDKALNLKMQEIQHGIDKCIDEKKAVAIKNDCLVKNQENWKKTVKELEEREKLSLASRDEKIMDLEEQIRDLRVYIEAQKRFADSDDIKGGTLLPVPLQQQSPSTNTKRRPKTNRRR